MLAMCSPYKINNMCKPENRMFSDFMTDLWNGETCLSMPAADIIENEKEFLIKAEIPGMDQKDIDISIDGNCLTIKGEKKAEKEEKGEKYLRREMSYGSFSRSFTINQEIKADEIKAGYKNGIVEITIPKEEKVKPKKIEIRQEVS
ncbi:MAG: Hsp20/alpha crystallin family protein [Candidatus Eremiobacterota bacterium]